MAKKNTKKGGNIKPIEEMINTQESNAEKFLDKLEKLEEKDNKDEPIVEQMDEQIVEQTVEPIDEEMEVHENMKILNINIKNAIYYNKDRSTKGITSDHYKKILKAYEKTTGVEMSKEQANYMKKLNSEQAKAVIYTINMFIKWEKQHQQLAEATN